MSDKAISKIDICNMAIDKIGGQTISSFEDKNVPNAEFCKRWYDNLRIALLRIHNWNFAKKYITLTPNSETPIINYSYCYDLPTDYIKTVNIFTTTDTLLAKYDIVGRKLYCNYDGLYMIYISDIDNISQFDPLFIDTLTIMLAKSLAFKTNLKSDIKSILQAEYMSALKMAQYIDNKETPLQMKFIDQYRQTTSDSINLLIDESIYG